MSNAGPRASRNTSVLAGTSGAYRGCLATGCRLETRGCAGSRRARLQAICTIEYAAWPRPMHCSTSSSSGQHPALKLWTRHACGEAEGRGLVGGVRILVRLKQGRVAWRAELQWHGMVSSGAVCRRSDLRNGHGSSLPGNRAEVTGIDKGVAHWLWLGRHEYLRYLRVGGRLVAMSSGWTAGDEHCINGMARHGGHIHNASRSNKIDSVGR
jgi:hypothetical protein